MATREEIYAAIVKADKAGDGEGVRALGAYLQTMPASAPKPPSDNSAARGFALGVAKPLDNLTSAAMQIPGVAALDRLGTRMGIPGAEGLVAANDAARANNSRTGYQALGNIVGAAPTMALPGGAAVQGMAGGALLSNAKDPLGVAKDTALGAVAGFGGDKLLRGAAGVIAPQFSKGMRALADADIPVTIGQLARDGGSAIGKAIGGVEDALTSVPFIGDMVNSARDRGTLAFNASVLNRSLGAIGEKLPKGLQAGRDAVKYVGDTFSAEYDKLVPNLSVTFDDAFRAQVDKSAGALRTLPQAMQKQFTQIVRSIFENRAAGGSMAGQALKDAQSRLREELRAFSATQGRDAQIVARTLDDLDGAFTDLIERANPQYAEKLKGLNAGYATLVQAEKAAGSVGAAKNNGMFTPAQFSNAVSALNSSARKRAVARGTALNQDLSDAAIETLPSQTPDSGTARRAMVGLMAGGGVSAGVGVLANPYAAIPLAAAASVYTKTGQKLIKEFVKPRGAGANATATTLRNLAPFAGRGAALGVPPLLARGDN